MFNKLLLSIVFIFLCVGIAVADPGQVNTVSTIAGVHRTGLNVGLLQYSGPAYYQSNALRNTGMEAVEAGKIIEVSNTSSTLFCELTSNYIYPNSFFNNATLEVVYSTANPSLIGQTGVVNAYTNSSGSCSGSAPQWGYVATFTLNNGDIVAVHQTKNPPTIAGGCPSIQSPNCGPVAGWWYDPSDTSWSASNIQNPQSVGDQSLQLTLNGTTHTINQYFDQPLGGTQIQNYFTIKGPWKFTIYTQTPSSVAPSCTASLVRGSTTYFSSSWTPTSTWTQTVVSFTGSDTTSTSIAQVQLSISCSGASGTILFDDAYVGPKSSTSIWRKPLLADLQTLNPGVIRDNGGNQGNSFANYTSALSARKISYYQGQYTPIYDYSLAELFSLAQQTLADPWIVIPVVLTDAEYVSLGQAIATFQLTNHFRKIYIEFGDQNWDPSSCAGTCFTQSGTISQTAWAFVANRAYGNIAAGAGLGSVLQFVGNGQWGSNPPSSTQMLSLASACSNCNIIDAAPFWYRCQNAATATATNIANLFDDPEQDNSQSIMTSIAGDLAGVSKGVSFYEMGPSVLGGDASTSQRIGIAAGAASASSETQTALRAFNAGIEPVTSWQMTQLSTPTLSSYSDCSNSPPSTTAPLWGDIYYIDTPQYRPRVLGLEMLNQYGIGSSADFYTIANLPTGVTGGAFLQTDGWHVVVTNSGATSQTVTITFPDATHKLPVNLRQLVFNTVTDNNDTISSPAVTVGALQQNQINPISSTQISFPVTAYGESVAFPVPAPPPSTSLVYLNRGLWFIGNNDDSTFTKANMPYGGVGYLARITGKNLLTTVGSPTTSTTCAEDWTALDTIVGHAQAGNYLLGLDINFGGEGTPDCLLNQLSALSPTGLFPTIWGFQISFTQHGNTIVPCSAMNVPVPWTPLYENTLQQFLLDLNTHLNSLGAQNIIPRIVNTATTINDDETSLPANGPASTSTITCNGATFGNTACMNAAIAAGGTWNSGTGIGTCPVANDASLWVTSTYQYTPQKVINASAFFDQAYHAALPNGCVTHMWLPNRFPPIDNSGNIISGQLADMPYPNLPVATILSNANKLDNFYCSQSNNMGLVAGAPRPNMNIAGSTLPFLIMLGFQSDGATLGNYPAMGLSLTNSIGFWGANWIELYQNANVWNQNPMIQWAQSELSNTQRNYNY